MTAGAVQCGDVADLTSKLTSDGHLNWRVPAGKWIVLRLAYMLTGVKNHPAPAEGEGLECDKFSKAALDAHWAGFMQKILDDLGRLAARRWIARSLTATKSAARSGPEISAKNLKSAAAMI